LKKLKFGTSNDDGNEKIMLQNEMVLAQSKEMDGRATYNVFKRRQNVINKISIPLIGPRPFTPPMVYEFLNELTFIQSFSLGLSSRHVL
jgi:hypothetical protein